MERFAQIVTAGGVALVVGLWASTLTTPASPPWLAGLGLALLGTAGIGAGIWLQLDAAVPGA